MTLKRKPTLCRHGIRRNGDCKKKPGPKPKIRYGGYGGEIAVSYVDPDGVIDTQRMPIGVNRSPVTVNYVNPSTNQIEQIVTLMIKLNQKKNQFNRKNSTVNAKTCSNNPSQCKHMYMWKTYLSKLTKLLPSVLDRIIGVVNNATAAEGHVILAALAYMSIMYPNQGDIIEKLRAKFLSKQGVPQNFQKAYHGMLTEVG